MPKFNAEQLTDAEDLDEIEFYNFHWQQKEFSTKELKSFSKLDNCKTDRAKEYHQRIVDDNRYLNENGDVIYEGKIFSYVNDDNYREKINERNKLAENVQHFGGWNDENGGFGKKQ